MARVTLRGEWDQLRERPLRGFRYLAGLIVLALFLWFLSHVTTGWFVGFATRAGIFAILAIGLNALPAPENWPLMSRLGGVAGNLASTPLSTIGQS